MTPEEDHRRGQGIGPARPRRSGLPDRQQVGAGPPGSRRREVRHLQRRRGRPRGLHGPLHPGVRSALRDRGHGHRARGPSAPTQGFVYVRAEYPLAVRAPDPAPSSRRGSTACWARTSWAPDFSFDLTREQGRRGLRLRRGDRADRPRSRARLPEPRPRPPFPAADRLCGASRPTSTTSRPGPMCRTSSPRGGDWFAALGTEKSKGTKVFSLVGKVKNTGLVEVPMGITLRRDRLRHRRRHPQGQEVQGGPDRRALGRLPAGSACWTCRWTTSRWPRPARSWAPAA